MSQADLTFSIAMVLALKTKSVDDAAANRDARSDLAEVTANDPYWVQRDDWDLNEDFQTDNAQAARAQNQKTYALTQIDQKDQKEHTKTPSIRDYHLAYHANEVQWTADISGYYALHETGKTGVRS